MSADKGFAVAIPSSQALYADTKLDITEEVLSKLDKELPDVKVVVKE
jgi:Skp family chaperone for outer membrane proteins